MIIPVPYFLWFLRTFLTTFLLMDEHGLCVVCTGRIL